MQFIQSKTELFKNLYIPEFFGGDHYDEVYPVVEDWIDNLQLQNNLEFEWFHGVSKVVCVFPNSEWVIKVPFNGSFNYPWDDKLDDYNFEDESWLPFTKASVYEWNYCELEVDVYEMAREDGLGIFFADTRKLCDSRNHYPIYIQEKVIPFRASKDKTPSKKAMDSAKKMSYDRFELDWVATAIDFYGEEKVEEFLYYVNELHPSIGSDMHSANYGYRPDGSPCLLDFSNWCEDD